jgi:hypothetical protein
VAFTVTWPGGSFGGCSAKTATTAGTWSCTVDLLRLGVPPGVLKASFDVVEANGKVAKGLDAARSVTYAVLPPKPQTTWRVVSNTGTPDGGDIEVDKLSWTEPDGDATEFRLYGVIGCPSWSEANDGQPCLVEHTSLPAKSLELIKAVGGTTRSIVLKHTIPQGACGPEIWCGAPHGSFSALVLGAYNAYGQSVFAIPVSIDVCFGCTY